MGGGQGGRVAKATHHLGRATVSKRHVAGAWDACWAWASSLGAQSTGRVLAASRPPSHPPRVCRPRPGDLPLRLCHLCRGVQDWEGDPGTLAQAAACPDRGSDPYSGPLHPHRHRSCPARPLPVGLPPPLLQATSFSGPFPQPGLCIPTLPEGRWCERGSGVAAGLSGGQGQV